MMKLQTKFIGAALGALLFSLTPAIANAERVFFLVGVRHIYRIGTYQNSHLAEREEIEKTYADKVASDMAYYQQQVDAGADKVQEAQNRDEDLDKVAAERDDALGALFVREDEIRDRHPELRVEGDGPYQVMEIHYHVVHDVEVFDQFVVWAPWPGYVVVGAPYGGWVWGRPYAPGIFLNVYLGWHAHFYNGGPFYGGFYGHRGFVPFEHGRFAGRARDFVRPGVGYAHGHEGVHPGNPHHGDYPHPHPGGYPRPGTGNPHPGGYPHAGAVNPHPGGYAHSGLSNSHAGSYPLSGHGYSHSGGGSPETGNRRSTPTDGGYGNRSSAPQGKMPEADSTTKPSSSNRTSRQVSNPGSKSSGTKGSSSSGKKKG